MATTVYQQVFQHFKVIYLYFFNKKCNFARFLGEKTASENTITMIIKDLHNEKVELL